MAVNVEQELKSVKDLVECVLKNDEEARNCDIKLYIECCKMLGAKTIDDIITIGANPQTIVRARKLLQNVEGLYPPNEEVYQSRIERSKKIRDYLGHYNNQFKK